jgi:hypothetical protein
MYQHHITRAAAEAHAADMHRGAARHRASARVRPHHRPRVIVGALVAICALGPTAGAGARPVDSVTAKWKAYDEKLAKLSPEERARAFGRQDLRSPDARDAAITHQRSNRSRATKLNESAQDLRSPDARDAADGRGTFNAPDVTVVKIPESAPTTSGIDWADVGIGAAGVLGMALLALGGTFVVAHRRHGARQTAPIA